MEKRTAETLIARAAVTVNASTAKVWDALVNPEVIVRYLPAASVVSEWRVDSPIVWKGEMEGRSFELRGTVLRLEPERLLEYDHSRPIFRASGPILSTARHHRVTIELSSVGARTQISVTDEGSTTERERAHADGGWRLALANMKALLEGTVV
jgi:uncharacterized protein YndB with AHSA1/START domain